MLNYEAYHPAMIAITDDGYAFIYWCDRKMNAHLDFNYGRGRQHWFEYLGKHTKEECKMKYPNTPILAATDQRINKFCKDKIQELYEMVTDDPK